MLKFFWKHGPFSRRGSIVNALGCTILVAVGIAVAVSLGDTGLLINVVFLEVVFVAIAIIVWTRRPTQPTIERRRETLE